MAFLEAHLGRDMALFLELRLFQRLVTVFEIGAGILHVLVEKEAKQLFVEVVVMGHVALCGIGQNAALELAIQDTFAGFESGGRRDEILFAAIEFRDHQQVVNVAFLDHQLAVHVKLGELQFRV